LPNRHPRPIFAFYDEEACVAGPCETERPCPEEQLGGSYYVNEPQREGIPVRLC
jgi:hypothetical protein